MTSKDNDNSALWQQLKQGDKESLQALYHHHFERLFEYGVRRFGDKELVKDCIHDLFVKLWDNRKTLGKVTTVHSYLLVALRSTIYNALQKNNRIKLYKEWEHFPFELEFSPEDHFIKKETYSNQTQKLIDALNQLTPQQKEAVYLRYFEDMDYNEIADTLQISIKATYKLMARGLQALRQVLHLSLPSLLILLYWGS